MLTIIKRYILKIFFALSVLFGLQLPHFLQQYELRLQAHLAEASLQLVEYQSLADKHFAGDLQALIQEHKSSHFSLFRDEAPVIERSYLRVQYLQQKVAYSDKPLWYRLALLTKEIESPIFKETWLYYKPNIVLNQESVSVGLIVAILLMLLLEFLTYLIRVFFCLFFSKTKTSFTS
jgi:hypothetical protein